MSKSLAKRLNLAESLREEIKRAQDRLPSRVAEKGVERHIPKYAAVLTSLCEEGFVPSVHELVWMPKANLRYRPLSALPLADRVVFRGLVDELTRNVTDLDAYSDTRATFESEPLDDERNFTHFGFADVASFYRYVPHEVLVRRITETTGQAELARSVRAFLRGVMQADFGLPQNVGPSDQCADLVIAPVERRLVRQGFAVTRYNDDFRIAATSNRALRRGIEALQNELYAIGLTLNDAKTRILRRDAYEAHVAQLADDDYEAAQEIEDQPTSDAQLEETRSTLSAGLRKARAGSRSRAQDSRALADVRRALKRLTRWRDPYALARGQDIVNRHPTLTQHYARYCAALVEAGQQQEVAKYLESRFGRFILTPWQELWLLEPIIAGAGPIGPNLRAWLQRATGPSTLPVLRARAAHAAACVGLLDRDMAGLLVDVSPEVARPDAIRAFALVHERSRARRQDLAGLPDSRLAGWVYNLQVDAPAS
jgi:hypothetical protein